MKITAVPQCIVNYLSLSNYLLFVVPGGLADVSVPDVVREDALGLVLEQLHGPGVNQSSCLWFEEYDGLQTSALCGIRRNLSKPKVHKLLDDVDNGSLASEAVTNIILRNRLDHCIPLSKISQRPC